MALETIRAMAPQGGGVLSRLSDEVLFLIVAKLPTITLVRMRAVCKRWNGLLSSTTAVKIIYRNVPIVSTPAFFIRLPCIRWCKYHEYPLDDMQSWVIDPATGDLLKVPIPNLDSDIMDLRRDANAVVCACKSIYCLSHKRSGFGTAFSICNPGTNTCKFLPYQKSINPWTFSGMAFDPSTMHFTLLLGRTDPDSDSDDEQDIDRHIIIDIYDSEANAWTVVEMYMLLDIGFPNGMGIYSKGRFHWLHEFQMGLIIQFNMSERIWTQIRPPLWVYFSDLRDLEDLEEEHDLNFKTMNYSLEKWDGRLAIRFHAQDGDIWRPCSWWLTGTDGRIILVNKDIRCVWELREETNEWCQLHITLPNPLYGVAVNSIGWTLVAGEKEMVIYNGEGGVVRTIEYSEFDPQALPMPKTIDLSEGMLAFEWNNVWWP